jgi:glycosyltransferase involved in cell wall biosynthesis
VSAEPPALSIVIPAYESHATLGDCLAAIERQTYTNYEVILVDSGPTDRGAEIAARRFPWVRLTRPGGRLLPHEARNLGVSIARSRLIVFTDPDIYPIPEWLALLVAAWERHGGMIVGSVGCFGRRWVDVGAHLAKFDLWLPGGPPREIEIAPTLNVLCPKEILEAVGGFRGEYMIGDTIFSWDAAAAGYRLGFEPMALVRHHHLMSWSGLLRERYLRGAEFGAVRARREGWAKARTLRHILITLLPLRWAGLVVRTLNASARARMLPDSLLTLPIIASGHAAWLAGECRSFLERVLGHERT